MVLLVPSGIVFIVTRLNDGTMIPPQAVMPKSDVVSDNYPTHSSGVGLGVLDLDRGGRAGRNARWLTPVSPRAGYPGVAPAGFPGEPGWRDLGRPAGAPPPRPAAAG